MRSNKEKAHQDLSPLSWEDVRAIRRACQEERIKQTLVAAAYEVSVSYVNLIVRNKTWHDPDYTPGVRQVCQRDGCMKWWISTKVTKKYCCGGHRSVQCARNARGLARRRARQVDTWTRQAMNRARSLDAPLTGDPRSGTLNDLIAATDAVDPQAVLETELLRDLLADVDEQTLENLSPMQLDRLRHRLLSAGFAPSARGSNYLNGGHIA